ncbi:hypothetical protein MXD62_14830 [Frankia sp. Mgl5]|nr:hypothetical protein [Frankia sp. Mgl5]
MDPDQPGGQDHQAQHLARAELAGERALVADRRGDRCAGEDEQENGNTHAEPQQERGAGAAAPALPVACGRS